jgi:hypothetical protein
VRAMGCKPRAAVALGFIVGCAAAPHVRAHWDTYCCAAGTVDDPRGCRVADSDGIEACREAGGWAMECRGAGVGECVGGGSDCFCCREVGRDSCTMRMRSARLSRPPVEEPAETYEATHPRPGRVWSPF